MDYAIGHHFERNSVVDFNDLAVTAMEKSMGGALPRNSGRKRIGQGVLFEGQPGTTQAVLDQEQKIIGFARAGKGSLHAAGTGRDDGDGLDGLSDEQKAAVRHVWDSSDQVILIRGGAGTGKTHDDDPGPAELGVRRSCCWPPRPTPHAPVAEGRL